ncbi:MAG: bifunctional protein PutA [marine bacterium B5-7]|nr:MAG: bifunctional protein PutA [marine bacterium B5-7]
MTLIQTTYPSSPLRDAITAATHQDETTCAEQLLQMAALSPDALRRIQQQATQLVHQVRAARTKQGGMDAFMAHYDLSSQEGIALMCLAEAMLRVPDQATVDKLIQDKMGKADWSAHSGKSESLFVNAATWGLMLTGKVLRPKAENVGGSLNTLLQKTSMPVIRKMVSQAMKILGEQFVMGRNIKNAVKRAQSFEKQGYQFSYDMLGEAAYTQADADRYFDAYSQAIDTIGQASQGRGPVHGPGISIKLSALHPRYEPAQYQRVMKELVPRVKALAIKARDLNIGLTIDAEEAERLVLSLDVIEAVFCDPDFKNWQGFGLALQAYQKRAPYVIDWLADMAKREGKPFMIRLVKGAYWDSEIKNAQEMGYDGYPVYTRKCTTDVSYIACVKKIFQQGACFYPQFATHNANSVATILDLAGDRRDFEFQALHGMGTVLYEHIVGPKNLDIPCRLYAPVGCHEELLPYLVRRLLENGANSSFVNRISHDSLPVSTLIEDPMHALLAEAQKPHPQIPLPVALYQPKRVNSHGIDFTNRATVKSLKVAMDLPMKSTVQAASIIDGVVQSGEWKDVFSPIDRRQFVGKVSHADEVQIEAAITVATKNAATWSRKTVADRATCLRKMAELLHAEQNYLMSILIREAGKTWSDAISEVREAIDFCYYYAMQAEASLGPQVLPGPTGEDNQLSLHGRGVILCISPWNFPLAIFLGQVTAALVAGNAVIAKPAEQTSLIAFEAVKLLHRAGVPTGVLQCLIGRGSVIGATLVPDNRVNGIMFTGSTETARLINQTLAGRDGPIVPFIAETGGQNAMIVDSSALPEQVVSDVVRSAFGSAGQRCSALRVLFVQADVADKMIEMLQGAMAELQVGDSQWLATDVGPVIDQQALQGLQQHVETMREQAKIIAQVRLPAACQHGFYMAPTALEIESLSQLKREEFGPILHVIRYQSKDLDRVIDDINATGYGLTLGIHSRVDQTVQYICDRVHVGNIYVNRNMIGAVVGVQPFGGEGLSGTGPKAGGPHYLFRLCSERTVSTDTTAAGGNASLLML